MGAYSIYLHLPFCVAKCPYCDFHSVPVTEPRFTAYRDALIAEWQTFAGRSAPPIAIYVGGGTPSVWPAEELTAILHALPMTRTAEVTVEINPGSATDNWLQTMRQAGVNRISVGVQALDDARLKRLGRPHTATNARRAIDAALSTGFRSVSADLIYGTWGDTPQSIEKELTDLVATGVHHVSAYELTLAPETPFGEAHAEGRLPALSDELMVDLWYTARNVLGAHGLFPYEVSNYARPDHPSVHNSHYWIGGEYIGLGSGAVGFIREGSQGVRYANTTDIDAYIAYWTNPDHGNDPPRETENLTRYQLAKEQVMLGLRTERGVDLARLLPLIPATERPRWRGVAQRVISRGFAQYTDGYLVPSPEGLLRADAIAQEFF